MANLFRIENGTVYVTFSNCNEEFLCDIDVWEELNTYTWFKANTGYAMTNINRVHYLFHRMVIECPEGMEVDHINRNKTDNRKSNLRTVTHRENNINKGITRANTSGCTGVSFIKNRNKWYANICVHGRTKGLGFYDEYEDAVKARKEAEIKYGY